MFERYYKICERDGDGGVVVGLEKNVLRFIEGEHEVLNNLNYNISGEEVIVDNDFYRVQEFSDLEINKYKGRNKSFFSQIGIA